MNIPTPLRRIATGIAVLGLILGAWLVGVAFRERVRHPGYEPQARIRAGDEIVLVFIGAKFCGACGSRELQRTVERAKLLSLANARDRGQRFRAIGVALDDDPRLGAGMLRRFGRSTRSRSVATGSTKRR